MTRARTLADIGDLTIGSDVAIDSNGGFLFDVSDKALEFGDNYKAVFGAGGDLEIYHSGSATLMEDKGTGPFVLRTNGNVIQLDTQFGSEVMGKFIKDGAVELYHNGTKRIETTAVGVGVNQVFGLSDTDTGIALGANGANIMQFYTGNSERVQIDASGNVGIGTSGPTHKLHVIGDVQAENSSGHRALIVKGSSTTNYEGGSLLLANAGMATNYGGTYLYHHKAGGSGTTNASFNISQRTAGGAYVSNIWNVDYQNSVQTFYVPNGGVSGAAVFQINSLGHILHKANHAGIIGTFENIHSSSPDGIDVAFTATAPDNNSRYFYRGRDNAVNRYYVYSDGDVKNHDNSYGATSDAKLKEQITDASSQWDDIKALRVRKYKMKSDVSAKGDSNELWRIGVIAQEVEAAGMNALVRNDPDIDNDGKDLGTTTKAMKYSILYMKAVKALQEAMTRIETLEAKVAKLEAGE